MVFDSYTHFRDTPGYNKIIGDNYLIVEFKCPIEAENFASWSECHYITYVLSGKKKWFSTGREYMLTEGESIFVQKGAYMNQQYFEEDFCVLMFFMNDEFIHSFVEKDLTEKAGSAPEILLRKRIYPLKVTETLQVIYSSFFTYLKEENEVPRKVIELKFREMLLNIVAQPENADTYQVLLSIASNQSTTMGRIMEDNFAFNMSLSEFARLCGKSLSSFKRDFKKQFNESPGKWLTQRRLAHARQLLTRTDQSVQEICFDCGFENCSHFIRIFRETFGITPSQFRQREPVAN